MKNRPAIVWGILIWYVISTVISVIAAWAILSGNIHIPIEKQGYFNQLSWMDYLATTAIAAFNLGGAVSIFALRKIAINLFVSGFVINIGLTTYQALGGYYTLEGITSYSRFVVPLFCIAYAIKMKKSGLFIKPVIK